MVSAVTIADHFAPGVCARLVVKIGSALLVDPAGAIRRDWLAGIVADVAALEIVGGSVS